MNRKELDAFVAHHGLSQPAVDVALDVSNARPTPAETQHFAGRGLQLAGVLSLAAGIVFFIAANWQEFHVFGRFVLIQVLLVASGAVALWKPPPQQVGRYALLMMFLMTGALLALFGQTYQTGADVYELFLTWAVLGIVIVLAGQWSVICAAWLLVLNMALLLFCGGRPASGWFWILFSDWDLRLTRLLLVPTLLNLVLWGVTEFLQGTRWQAVASRWVGRLALTCAVGFGTWAGALGIFDSDELAALIWIVLLAGITVYVLRKRVDVFPLTLVAASFIVLSTSALGEYFSGFNIGKVFLIALWLVVSSTVSGRLLMKLVRDWRDREVHV